MKFRKMICGLFILMNTWYLNAMDSKNLFPNPPNPETVSMVLDSIQVQQTITPVLIGKENNPLLQIQVLVQGQQEPLILNAIGINTLGTTHRQDLAELKMFYTGNSEKFETDQQFGQIQAPAEKLTFYGNVRLRPGVNNFWVAAQLATSADLLHQVDAGCEFIQLHGLGKQFPPVQSPTIRKRIGVALRKRGDDGVHTYRIPGLVTTNNGTLMAVFDARRNSSVDLQEDIDIGLCRSFDGGQTWEPMQIIMDLGEWGGRPQSENGIGDPSILVDRFTGTIWVAALWAHGHPGKRSWVASQPGLEPAETGQLLLVKSEDDGKSWSKPMNITRQIKRPEWQLLLVGPGKGIVLTNRTLVFAAQFKNQEQMPFATIIYSKDHGQTWHIGTGAQSNTTESQVVQLDDGSLMLNMRDNRGGSRAVYVTKDLGKSWEMHPSSRKALPEPVCMASLIKHRLAEGSHLLLFSNPATTDDRYNMTLKISRDEGLTWPEQYHFLYFQEACYGYSCLTSIDENTIGVLYEGEGELYFEKFKLGDLLK